MASFIQGEFKPKNVQKYVGGFPIIFRSSWERKFMGWLDMNISVTHWSSESIIVPYYNVVKKRICRYFPDFYMRVVEKGGQVKEYLIEVKPDKETRKPVKTKGKRTATWTGEAVQYLQNLSKWTEAKKFSEKRGWIFKVITEKDLNI